MKRIMLGMFAASLLMRDAGNPSDGATGAAPASTPAPSLSDLVTENFKALSGDDAAQAVISASDTTISELKGLTFGGLSPLGQQIMASQVAEAVKTVEIATKNVLDTIEA